MESLNLTHVSVLISGATLITILKITFQIGKVVEQFDALKLRVKLHDKLLGLDVDSPIPTHHSEVTQ